MFSKHTKKLKYFDKKEKFILILYFKTKKETVFLMKIIMYKTMEVTMTNYFSKSPKKPKKQYSPIRAGPDFEFYTCPN